MMPQPIIMHIMNPTHIHVKMVIFYRQTPTVVVHAQRDMFVMAEHLLQTVIFPRG